MWLGPEYAVYAPAVAVMAVAIYVYALFQASVVFAVAMGHPSVVAVQSVVLLILTAGQSAYLPHAVGVTGGALAIAIPVISLYPYTQMVTSRITGLRWVPTTVYCVGGLLAAAVAGILCSSAVELVGGGGAVVDVAAVCVGTTSATIAYFGLTREKFMSLV